MEVKDIRIKWKSDERLLHTRCDHKGSYRDQVGVIRCQNGSSEVKVIRGHWMSDDCYQSEGGIVRGHQRSDRNIVDSGHMGCTTHASTAVLGSSKVQLRSARGQVKFI